jgi:hypothetical protein
VQVPDPGVVPEDWGRRGIRLLRGNGGFPLDDRRVLMNKHRATISDDSTPVHLRSVSGLRSGFEVKLITPVGPEVRVRISICR